MSFVVAVDSGGTFTDCVVVDDDGRLSWAKSPSTPRRFEEGVLGAVSGAADRLGLQLGDLLADTRLFSHGTTVATNILITRTGARTALLTTRGHEDAIIIGRTVQKVAGLSEGEIIDVARLSKADPLVPRSNIHGVDERVDRNGSIVAPLRIERLDRLAAQLREEGVESIAISLLWSFLNPDHEQQLRGLAERKRRWAARLVRDRLQRPRAGHPRVRAHRDDGVERLPHPGASRLPAQRLDEAACATQGTRGAISVMHSARRGVAARRGERARCHPALLGAGGRNAGREGLPGASASTRSSPPTWAGRASTSARSSTASRGTPTRRCSPSTRSRLPIIDVDLDRRRRRQHCLDRAGLGGAEGRAAERGSVAGPGLLRRGRGGADRHGRQRRARRHRPGPLPRGRMRLDRDAALEAMRSRSAEPLGLQPEEAPRGSSRSSTRRWPT